MWQGQVTKNARLKIDKGYTGLSRNQCKYQTFFPDVHNWTNFLYMQGYKIRNNQYVEIALFINGINTYWK